MKEYEQEGNKNENVASEPGVEYAVRTVSPATYPSTDVDSETIITEEEIEARLEAFFAEQKELFENNPVPEGYLTIEEAYQESLKHLEELYAKKKNNIES